MPPTSGLLLCTLRAAICTTIRCTAFQAGTRFCTPNFGLWIYGGLSLMDFTTRWTWSRCRSAPVARARAVNSAGRPRTPGCTSAVQGRIFLTLRNTHTLAPQHSRLTWIRIENLPLDSRSLLSTLVLSVRFNAVNGRQTVNSAAVLCPWTCE